ncbi:hypothetical protein [Nonomuraea candida]|uniref:hypothetical protein n=1 Tax=Nonomuraea candida TaxID=359159 RepID=UPI000B194A82|nr:hypothetical protein [Nonomuraea candida]
MVVTRDPDVVPGRERRTIAILPRSLVRPVHPDLVYRPVTGAPSSALVVAWARDDRRRLVASFVAAAVEAARAT